MARAIVLFLILAAAFLPAWPEREPGLLAVLYPDAEGRALWEGRLRPDAGEEGAPEIAAEIDLDLARCRLDLRLEGPMDAGSAVQETEWKEWKRSPEGKVVGTQGGRAEGAQTYVRVDEAAGAAGGTPGSFQLARGPAGRHECRSRLSTLAEYRLRFRVEGRAYTVVVAVEDIRSEERRVRIRDGHE